MKNLKYLFLILCFLSILMQLRAQHAGSNEDVTIHFRQGDTWTPVNFDVIIEKKAKFIKINYSLRDSLRFSALKKDTLFKIIRAKINDKNATDSEKRLPYKQFKDLIEQYTPKYKDSIVLASNEYRHYSKLLINLAKLSKDDLDKNNHSRVMDVGYTTCNITFNGETKDIDGTVDQTVTKSAIINFIKHTIALDQNKDISIVARIKQRFYY